METTSPDNDLLRIRSIELDGLFNLYNHRINLDANERVTIIYGPNGVGKTAVLRMIQAVAEERFSTLRKFPFRRFSLSFTDGAILEIRSEETKDAQTSHKVVLHSAGGETKLCDLSTDNDVVAMAEHLVGLRPEIVRTDDDLWINKRTGRLYGAAEIVERFGSLRIRKQLMGSVDKSSSSPSWLHGYLSNINIHLIETQRLLREKPVEVYGSQLNSGMVSTVLEYAQDLKRSISEVMAQYGRQSQALDQSFPQRLLASRSNFDPEGIKNRMEKLEQKRNSLKQIGIFDETPAHPFDMEQLDNLDGTQKSVMTLYVEDSEQKLQVLDDLSRRITLLLDNVNQKFQHKRIRIDRSKGLVAEGHNGQPLALDVLSSGEQHELVLYYDLLFRVRPNTLVLIDEPELSLHVVWQKRFLPDLLEIARTVGFDVLVATHSPFIAGDRTDLMVALEAEAA